MFESLDEKVRGKHCDGIAGIIEEGKSIMEEDFDDDTMDACLIAAGQRAEHYEMAAYGTLVAWARAMGHTEAADLLQETLDEEKAADKKLSSSRRAASTRTRPRPPIQTRMRKPQRSALARGRRARPTARVALVGGRTSPPCSSTRPAKLATVATSTDGRRAS